MNPVQILSKQIEIKRAEAHVQNLKTNIKNMKIFNKPGTLSTPQSRKEHAADNLRNLKSQTNKNMHLSKDPFAGMDKANLLPSAIARIEKAHGLAPTAAAKPVVKPVVKPTASARPTPAQPAPGLTTAASFATPQLKMLRTDFGKLSAADKSRFLAAKGTLV